MDKSVIPVKYWGMGNTLLIGDEDEIVFGSNEDLQKAVKAIELIDTLMGGVKHERL